MFGFFRSRKPESPQAGRVKQLIRTHFGFTPDETDLYVMALRHSSAVPRGQNAQKVSNERLEFLGDAVLDLIVADYLHAKHPEMSEGDLTKMKAKVVSRKMLNAIGLQIHIHEHVDARLGGQPINHTIIGNALEALIGAIYLDKGYDFTAKKVLALLKANGIDQTVHLTVDFKSKLHEHCQKMRKNLTFIVLNDNGEESDHRYTVEVLIDNRPFGRGLGKSKKVAEQEAAKNACIRMFGDED
ncbi:MAG: ribonuclease [Bacteroidota bacterium]